MPTTAFQHFQDDVARARAIIAHADPLPQGTALEQRLRSDLLRSAWMFAVGALDATFVTLTPTSSPPPSSRRAGILP
jgi:hypothetical protein